MVGEFLRTVGHSQCCPLSQTSSDSLLTSSPLSSQWGPAMHKPCSRVVVLLVCFSFACFANGCGTGVSSRDIVGTWMFDHAAVVDRNGRETPMTLRSSIRLGYGFQQDGTFSYLSQTEGNERIEVVQPPPSVGRLTGYWRLLPGLKGLARIRVERTTVYTISPLTMRQPDDLHQVDTLQVSMTRGHLVVHSDIEPRIEELFRKQGIIPPGITSAAGRSLRERDYYHRAAGI